MVTGNHGNQKSTVVVSFSYKHIRIASCQCRRVGPARLGSSSANASKQRYLRLLQLILGRPSWDIHRAELSSMNKKQTKYQSLLCVFVFVWTRVRPLLDSTRLALIYAKKREILSPILEIQVKLEPAPVGQASENCEISKLVIENQTDRQVSRSILLFFEQHWAEPGSLLLLSLNNQQSNEWSRNLFFELDSNRLTLVAIVDQSCSSETSRGNAACRVASAR